MEGIRQVVRGVGNRGFAGLCRALLMAALVVLAGCAANEPKVLHYGTLDAPEGKRLLWPPEPEVPRYLFLGQLVGEANFRPKDGSSGRSFGSWLAGLIFGEDKPQVLQRPQAVIADDDGRVFVSDASRGGVQVFDAVAGYFRFWEFVSPGVRFVSPSGLALGPDGHLLVSDPELGLVTLLGPDGTPHRQFGLGVLKRPTGLAFDSERHEVYVADTYAHDIKVFDWSGGLVRVIGSRGVGPGQFNFPTYLALVRGRLHVSDTMNARVQVLRAEDGVPLAVFGERGVYVGNLTLPKGIAVDSDDNIYVVESQFDHLLVFDREGRFLMGLGGVGQQTGQFFSPAGVWVDAKDRVFVADMFNGRITTLQYLGGDSENGAR